MPARFRKTRKAAEVQVRPSEGDFFEGSTARKEIAPPENEIIANNKNTRYRQL
jgi:hypothetical protein